MPDVFDVIVHAGYDRYPRLETAVSGGEGGEVIEDAQIVPAGELPVFFTVHVFQVVIDEISGPYQHIHEGPVEKAACFDRNGDAPLVEKLAGLLKKSRIHKRLAAGEGDAAAGLPEKIYIHGKLGSKIIGPPFLTDKGEGTAGARLRAIAAGVAPRIIYAPVIAPDDGPALACRLARAAPDAAFMPEGDFGFG